MKRKRPPSPLADKEDSNFIRLANGQTPRSTRPKLHTKKWNVIRDLYEDEHFLQIGFQASSGPTRHGPTATHTSAHSIEEGSGKVINELRAQDREGNSQPKSTGSTGSQNTGSPSCVSQSPFLSTLPTFFMPASQLPFPLLRIIWSRKVDRGLPPLDYGTCIDHAITT
jgi:hypothetical protein